MRWVAPSEKDIVNETRATLEVTLAIEHSAATGELVALPLAG